MKTIKSYAALCLLLFVTTSPLTGYGDELMDKIKKARLEREQVIAQLNAGQPPASKFIAPPHVLPTPLNGAWYYQGKLYKGTLFKLSADYQKVYVTSDWDGYRGTWLDVADLDIGTRVVIGVATTEEKAKYAKMKAEQDAQAERDREMALIMAQQEEKQRKLEEQEQTEAQKLAIQQEILELLRRQEILLRNQSGPIYIYLPDL